MKNMYLRPKRGRKNTAIKKRLVLKRGEVFFEYPDNGPGSGIGAIKVGDGITEYKNLPYFLNKKEIYKYFIDDYKSVSGYEKGTDFQLYNNNIIRFRSVLENNSVQFDDTNGNPILCINNNGLVSIRNTRGELQTIKQIVNSIINDERYYTKEEIDKLVEQTVTKEKIVEHIKKSGGMENKIKITTETLHFNDKDICSHTEHKLGDEKTYSREHPAEGTPGELGYAYPWSESGNWTTNSYIYFFKDSDIKEKSIYNKNNGTDSDGYDTNGYIPKYIIDIGGIDRTTETHRSVTKGKIGDNNYDTDTTTKNRSNIVKNCDVNLIQEENETKINAKLYVSCSSKRFDYTTGHRYQSDREVLNWTTSDGSLGGTIHKGCNYNYKEIDSLDSISIDINVRILWIKE